MAGANTAAGAKADADAKASGKTAETEVSSSGVETPEDRAAEGDVNVGETRTTANFEPITVYRGEDSQEVTSLEKFYALQFDGWSEEKPDAKADSKANKS